MDIFIRSPRGMMQIDPSQYPLLTEYLIIQMSKNTMVDPHPPQQGEMPPDFEQPNPFEQPQPQQQGQYDMSKTPKENNHGWWNCDDCRAQAHGINYPRVEAGMFSDPMGNYFTLEYLKDMHKFYEKDTDRGIVVMDFIHKWNDAVSHGMSIPANGFY